MILIPIKKQVSDQVEFWVINQVKKYVTREIQNQIDFVVVNEQISYQLWEMIYSEISDQVYNET